MFNDTFVTIKHGDYLLCVFKPDQKIEKSTEKTMSNTCPRCGGNGKVMAQGHGRTGWDICPLCTGLGILNPGLKGSGAARGNGLTLFGFLGGGFAIYFYWSNIENFFGLLIPGVVGAVVGMMAESWLSKNVVGRLFLRVAYGLALLAIIWLLYQLIKTFG